MHRMAERFWKCFEKLPTHIQDLAKDNFELLKNDPKHPSLHFKKGWKILVCKDRTELPCFGF